MRRQNDRRAWTTVQSSIDAAHGKACTMMHVDLDVFAIGKEALR